MKKAIIFAVAAIMAVASCFAFGGCKGEDVKTKDTSAQQESVKDSSAVTAGGAEDADAQPEGSAENSAPESSDAPAQVPAENGSTSQRQAEVPESKYGNAEVYKNEAGNPAAKTESGVEVELTNENMSRMYEEYEKVRGTNSEEEREILEQIQVMLDVIQNQNVAQE